MDGPNHLNIQMYTHATFVSSPNQLLPDMKQKKRIKEVNGRNQSLVLRSDGKPESMFKGKPMSGSKKKAAPTAKAERWWYCLKPQRSFYLQSAQRCYYC